MSGYHLGDFRHALKLQDFVLAPDGQGGYIELRQPVEECPVVYAMITADRATRGLEAGQLKTRSSYKIVIAYRADVKAGQRLLEGDTVYTIDAVLDVGHRKEYLEIQARSE